MNSEEVRVILKDRARAEREEKKDNKQMSENKR